jgi:uncharacterized protein
MTRRDVRVDVEDTSIAAWVYRPEGDELAPAILLGHGFGLTRSAGLAAYAEAFRDAGFVAITFDYRHFGDSGGEPRQLLSIGHQIQDWHAMLRFARVLPGVDASRIALWGTSFAGGHVLRVAAEDGMVAAAVSQVPFMAGLATTLRLPRASVAKVGGLAAADLARAAVGASPVMMPLVGRPGEAAAKATDEAVEGYHRLYEGQQWENTVCARIGLSVPTYRPLRYAARVSCPLLIQAAEEDNLTPLAAAEKAARRAPRGEFLAYPIGHFDAYFDAWFDKIVADQVDFFTRHRIL